MVAELVFTDEEIRLQLEAIGLDDVTDEQLRLFRQDLERLIQEDAETRQFTTNMEQSMNDKSHLMPVSVANQANCSQSTLPHKESNDSKNSTKGFVRIEKVKLKSNAEQSLVHNCAALDDELKLDILKPVSQNFQNTDSSTTIRPRTRKVLRHINGKSVVCDESTSQSSDSYDCIPNSLRLPDFKELRPSNSRMMFDSDRIEPVSYLRRTKSATLSSTQTTTLKSLKSDPVALYHYYKREWERHKAPGEKDHSELRWNIRRSMMMITSVQRASSAGAIL